MATAILDRFQESKLERLEELMGSWSQASSDDEQGAIADLIVDEGIGLRQGLVRLWDVYWKRALAGAVAERPAARTKLHDLFERGGRALSQGAELARAYATLSGLEVARLEAFEEQVRAFANWALERIALWDMLDEPRMPVDREQVARSLAAFARGECEDVAEILARLQQGGPLLKE